MIFENLVLIAGGASEGLVQAKPIAELLDFKWQRLSPANPDDLHVFYEIRNGEGFHVPKLFDAYLRQHGGIEFSGLPVGEVFQLETGAFGQCFSNLCVEFDPEKAAERQLSLLPIGARYKAHIYDKSEDFSDDVALGNIDLLVWSEPGPVSPHDVPVIYVSAREAGFPLSNREPWLVLERPDGGKLERRFPPTGLDGQTMLRLEPIPGPTGTLVIYQVCLEALQGEKKCVEQSYLIWNLD